MADGFPTAPGSCVSKRGGMIPRLIVDGRAGKDGGRGLARPVRVRRTRLNGSGTSKA
jgi:hypothetical protein